MSSDIPGNSAEHERFAMLAALVNGDVALAYRLTVEMLAEGMPFDDIAVRVLAPVQEELGRRWASGDLGIADEHAASAVVEELLTRLGAIAEPPHGPSVVIASAEHDAHALGARVVASALALEGFRVQFLGASVPAADLGDFLDLHRPLAFALSCSMPTALATAARSVATAHDLGIPVVGGGRSIASIDRATRLGIDALARVPGDAVRVVRAWELSPPGHLGAAPDAIPESVAFAVRSPALVGAAIAAGTTDASAIALLGEELHRVLHTVEGALLLDEPAIIEDYVRWLRDIGPSRGLTIANIDTALGALADGMGGDLWHAGTVLRSSLS